MAAKTNLNKFLTHADGQVPVTASLDRSDRRDRSLTGDERAMMLDVMETLKVESQNSKSMIEAGEVDALVGENRASKADARKSPQQR